MTLILKTLRPGFIIYTLLLIIVTLAPAKYMSTPEFKFSDKFLHAITFGFWSVGYYLDAVFIRKKHDYSGILKESIIYGAIFGMGIELLQLSLPLNRSFEMADFYADLIGIVPLSYLIYNIIRSNKTFINKWNERF